MRGDSRLDLYAKSLALTGLGLVGAIGALIDYWPDPVRVPRVDSINVWRATPAVHTLVDFPGLDPFPPSPAPIQVAAARAELPARASVPVRTATRVAPDEWTVDAADVPDIPAPPVELRLPVQEMALASALPPVSLLPELEAPAVAFPSWQPMTPPAVAIDRSDDGFFSGMLKKTGSSVSTSLGKASNSLVGAVRAVGDVVKKAF